MKTLKEFDYDLWAIKENGIKKYYARIKRTGEVAEISIEVMRVLLNDEKRMRREKDAIRRYGTPVSIDDLSNERGSHSESIVDPFNVEEYVEAKIMEETFVESLTSFQKEVYFNCMKNSISCSEFARTKGLDTSTIYESRNEIRKKAKKYFF